MVAAHQAGVLKQNRSTHLRGGYYARRARSSAFEAADRKSSARARQKDNEFGKMVTLTSRPPKTDCDRYEVTPRPTRFGVLIAAIENASSDARTPHRAW